AKLSASFETSWSAPAFGLSFEPEQPPTRAARMQPSARTVAINPSLFRLDRRLDVDCLVDVGERNRYRLRAGLGDDAQGQAVRDAHLEVCAVGQGLRINLTLLAGHCVLSTLDQRLVGGGSVDSLGELLRVGR